MGIVSILAKWHIWVTQVISNDILRLRVEEDQWA
jgi:hypothetical protein